MRPDQLCAVYHALLERYGPQHWWPGETPFEVMVGAVLTQNAAWANVARAIDRLKAAACLDPRAILDCDPEELADLLRPSGYFNVKAARLSALCAWYLEAGGMAALAQWPTDRLRHELLRVKGVGPETADDILLYAFERPVFVIDAYTRRLFSRLGLIQGQEDYEVLRRAFEAALGPDVPVYNEYHALIVRQAKEVCRTRPQCERCPVRGRCRSATLAVTETRQSRQRSRAGTS